jgi:antagonist of KipI
MLSTAVTPGTIQVTGNGSLILLMADCQTTGGYPRIAKVAEVDMPLCGQLKAHDVIHFEQINWNEAEMLYLKQEKNMLLSGLAIKLKYQNFKVI